jgi:hypothetical protein
MRQYKFICDYLAIFGRNKFDAAQCPRQFRVPNKGVEAAKPVSMLFRECWSEEKGEAPSEPLQRIMDDLDYQI